MTTSQPREASVAGLCESIEMVRARGSLLVGSLGRGATLECLTGDASREFRERGEDILRGSTGQPRDADAIGDPLTAEELAVMSAHRIDTVAFQSRWLSIWREDGVWYYRRQFMRKPGYTGTLDPAIMKPVHGRTVFDRPCITVRPATHYVLLVGAAVGRRTSQNALQLLREVMPSEERELVQSPPYRKLAEILLDR